MRTNLRFAAWTISTLEVPNELALVLTLSGCDLRCPGCHSADLRNPDYGLLLDREKLLELTSPYQGMLSCVCFLGGEWQAEALVEQLILCHSLGLKTCLYTGRESCADEIAVHLDYLKLGPYRADRGPLSQAGTNQRFLKLSTGEDLTYLFQRESTTQHKTLAA